MSLRTWMATMLLQGILAGAQGSFADSGAKMACNAADNLLAELGED